MERFSTIGEMPEDLSVLTQASIVMSPVPKLSPGASFAWTYWLIPLNDRASRTLATVCIGPFWSTPFSPSTSSCAVVPESSSSGNHAVMFAGGGVHVGHWPTLFTSVVGWQIGRAHVRTPLTPISTLFPYTTLFRSRRSRELVEREPRGHVRGRRRARRALAHVLDERGRAAGRGIGGGEGYRGAP